MLIKPLKQLIKLWNCIFETSWCICILFFDIQILNYLDIFSCNMAIIWSFDILRIVFSHIFSLKKILCKKLCVWKTLKTTIHEASVANVVKTTFSIGGVIIWNSDFNFLLFFRDFFLIVAVILMLSLLLTF